MSCGRERSSKLQTIKAAAQLVSDEETFLNRESVIRAREKCRKKFLIFA